MATAKDINLRGVIADIPAASTSYSGVFFYATDVNGGTLYRCNNTGTTWEQTDPALYHAAQHHTGGSDALAPADIGALAASNNLSDVASAPTALTNLGAEASLGNPSNNGDSLVSTTGGTRSWATKPSLTSSTPAAETIGATGAVGAATTAAKADHVHAMPSNVTDSVDGFMSASDKAKLDGIASSATNTPLSSSTPTAETVGASGSAGSSSSASKADHTHAMPGAFVASGTGHAAGFVPDPGASAGSTKFLREDSTWAVPSGGGGSVPTFVTRETPSGTQNGSNTSFTIANAPTSGSEELFVNGVLQDYGSGNDYTISGTTLTLVVPPLSTDKLRINYRY